jgi:hypothetical protein
MIQFIKSLFRPKVSAAFAYGRFNPCHTGHIQLWKLVEKTSKTWYIGSNSTTNDAKNPLSFSEKTDIITALYPPMLGHFVAERSILTLADTIFNKLGKDPSLTIAYITDNEDWKWSGELLNRYNGELGPHGYYNFKKIIHVSCPRISSATEMRLAVKQKDPVAFYKASGVSPSLLINNKPYFDIVSTSSNNFKKSKKQVNTL